MYSFVVKRLVKYSNTRKIFNELIFRGLTTFLVCLLVGMNSGDEDLIFISEIRAMHTCTVVCICVMHTAVVIIIGYILRLELYDSIKISWKFLFFLRKKCGGSFKEKIVSWIIHLVHRLESGLGHTTDLRSCYRWTGPVHTTGLECRCC